MNDDIIAFRAQFVVAPDGQSGVAESPYGSFLIEAQRDTLPADIGLSGVKMHDLVSVTLDFPEDASPCIAVLRFTPAGE